MASLYLPSLPCLLPPLPISPLLVLALPFPPCLPPDPPDGEAAAPCCRLRAVVPGVDGRAGDWPCCSLPSLLSPASACQSFSSAAGNPHPYFFSSCSYSCQFFQHSGVMGQLGRARRILGAQRGQQGSFLGQPYCYSSTVGST